MSTTRFDTCRAKAISWVTTTMVMPVFARSAMTPSTSPVVSGSSALVRRPCAGRHSRRNLPRIRRARAMMAGGLLSAGAAILKRQF